MKRNLLIPLIISQSLMANPSDMLTKANDRLQSLCPDKAAVNLEDVSKESNKIWKEIVDQLNNANISYGIDKTFKLSDRSSLKIGKDTNSEPSIGSKYSGMDKWSIEFGATLFQSDIANLGISTRREVTFIQQFENRCKSLVRLAYDPISKIPLNSDRAINDLKPGDFVAFSLPLTLSLGNDFSKFFKKLDDRLRNFGDGSIYASGEINIHVFRMDNKYVRVRFFSSQTTKGGKSTVGPKFYALNSIGYQPLSVELAASLNNLFSADYVFNLNDSNTAKVYDSIMGEKLNLAKFAVKGTLPFESENSVKSYLFSDLAQVNKISNEDLSTPLHSRRIIRLSSGDTKAITNNQKFSLDFLLASAKRSATYSKSEVSTYNVENQNEKYIIKSISRESRYNLFEFWGQQDTHSTALLIQSNGTDGKFSPLNSVGLQTIRTKDELSFSKDEIESFKNRLSKTLPKAIRTELAAQLNFDTSKLTRPIANARIEQSIFLDTQALEGQKSITLEKVRSELTRFIQIWGRLNSHPMDTNFQSSNADMDPRLRSWKKADLDSYSNRIDSKDYLEAYSWELGYIPTYLSGLFGTDSILEKIAYYDKLQEIPLFNEIGLPLVLSLIEAKEQEDLKNNTSGTQLLKMSDVVSYRLSITGRGIEPKTAEYPVPEDTTIDEKKATQHQKKSEIIKRILNDNAYQTDRSFNLRYYMNEKGESLSLQEVVDRSK